MGKLGLWAGVRGKEAEAESRSQGDLQVGSTSSQQPGRAGKGSDNARDCVIEKSLWFLGLIGVRLETGRPGRRLDKTVF